LRRITKKSVLKPPKVRVRKKAWNELFLIPDTDTIWAPDDLAATALDGTDGKYDRTYFGTKIKVIKKKQGQLVYPGKPSDYAQGLVPPVVMKPDIYTKAGAQPGAPVYDPYKDVIYAPDAVTATALDLQDGGVNSQYHGTAIKVKKGKAMGYNPYFPMAAKQPMVPGYPVPGTRGYSGSGYGSGGSAYGGGVGPGSVYGGGAPYARSGAPAPAGYNYGTYAPGSGAGAGSRSYDDYDDKYSYRAGSYTPGLTNPYGAGAYRHYTTAGDASPLGYSGSPPYGGSADPTGYSSGYGAGASYAPLGGGYERPFGYSGAPTYTGGRYAGGLSGYGAGASYAPLAGGYSGASTYTRGLNGGYPSGLSGYGAATAPLGTGYERPLGYSGAPTYTRAAGAYSGGPSGYGRAAGPAFTSLGVGYPSGSYDMGSSFPNATGYGPMGDAYPGAQGYPTAATYTSAVPRYAPGCGAASPGAATYTATAPGGYGYGYPGAAATGCGC